MLRFSLSAAIFFLATLGAHAHDASVEMAAAAKAWQSALTPEQKAKSSFEFGGTDRTDWHFIPRQRKGLSIKEMTQEQRLLAHALLATGLSHRGYTKAVSIMSLESILAELEKGRSGAPVRDPEQYFVSIFGAPGVEPWGWRVEGHHLALNFTAAGGTAPAMTPSFFGTNPGEVKEGGRAGTRVLGQEEELGRTLVKSLTDDQKKKAIILAEAPKEIFNVPGRNDTKAEGISWTDLNATQREGLMKIVQEYVGRHRPDVAAEDIEKLKKAGLDKICFAWAGGLERGEPHYYRVQGGSFVLEYDNVQNGANHVHSVWRDFDHDFGADLLGEHYKAAHAK
ncbi:MAG TPA: DUF3500 domain-containing protein [Chthoniobacteraceae bacterium]|nr:DUF3500 domain-containing protein [Chthoniobacteraceae bacterium]